ncbi:hypothetical protein [Brevundimonas aurifodinae]|uniref:Uncharacterized protein n=1 Tax=Brevundimonas aurifodinae TaxID=1508312 RepID=A0ABV1NLL9_9CAUL
MTELRDPPKPIALDEVLNRFDAPQPSPEFYTRTLAAVRETPQRRPLSWSRVFGWKALLIVGVIGGGGLAVAATGILWRSSTEASSSSDLVKDETATTRPAAPPRPVETPMAPSEALDPVWQDLSPQRLTELEAAYDVSRLEPQGPISAGAASELRALAGAPRLDRPRFEAALDRNGLRLPRRPASQGPVPAREVDLRSRLQDRRASIEARDAARDRTRTGSSPAGPTVPPDLGPAVGLETLVDARSQPAGAENGLSAAARPTNRDDPVGPVDLERFRALDRVGRSETAAPTTPDAPARPDARLPERGVLSERLERSTRPQRPERPERPPRVSRPGRE